MGSRVPRCITIPNFMKISQPIVKILQFKTSAAAIFDFQNREILLAAWGQRAEVHRHAKFCQKWRVVSEDIKIFPIFNMVAICYLGCLGLIWTTHGEYLVVSITVQNLVTIDVVISKIWKFHYLAQIAGKRLFTPPKLWF